MAIRIIGSSHIARDSVREVREQFEDFDPDIVALELDPRRLHALLRREERSVSWSAITRIGLAGFLFALFAGYASKKLGDLVGMSPGSEMKEAYRLAKKHGKQVALIDQDLEVTLARFSRAFTWKEKWQIVKDVLEAVFHRQRVLARYGNPDLSRVPEDRVIELILQEAKAKYPTLYRVLIDERNRVMAFRLGRIRHQNPGRRILAVVGAGHKKAIESMLTAESLSEGAQYTYSFSFDQNN